MPNEQINPNQNSSDQNNNSAPLPPTQPSKPATQPNSPAQTSSVSGQVLGYQQRYFPNQKTQNIQSSQQSNQQSTQPNPPAQTSPNNLANQSAQTQKPQANFQAGPQQSATQMPGRSMALQSGRNIQGARRPPDPKKVIYGCLSFFGCSIFLFIIFVIVFVSQTSSTGENGLARALNLDPASFTNSLILLTNLVFGLFAITTFTLSMVGLFRYVMSRKDDKPGKSKAVSLAAISGVVFLVMILIWVTVYIYLSGKKVNIPKTQTRGIITQPADTRLLTAPIEITFDGTQVPNNATQTEIISYLWSFGDGKSSTSPIVKHTYTDQGSNNGQFDVNLTVTKRDRRTSSNTTETYTTVVTIANVQLFADFTADPEKGPAPLTVNFDGSTSKAPAGEITEYAWDFQGNNTFRDAQGVKSSYTFPQEGEYKVSLRVVDNTGQKPAIVTKTILVEGPNTPVATIEIPTDTGKYFTNKQYTFYGEKSTSPNGNISKYEWDFGDGGPKANTRTANHSYDKAGEYEVILKATDEQGKTGQTSQKIKVETTPSAPTAVIDSVPQMNKLNDGFIAGTVPYEVAFSASNSKDPDNNIIEYKWDFDGDGKIDETGEQTKYVYKTPGVYNASLFVTDSTKNESKTVLVIKVSAQDLKAAVTAQPIDGVVPLTVAFDASGSSYPSGQIVSYEWDFGDGGAKRIDVAQVSYKYDKIGTFKASVIAKSSDGKTAQTTIDINVRPPVLKACFKPSVEQGPAPLTIEFDPRCTSGPAAKFNWDFGDGETSRTRKPTHTYQKAGSYPVSLEVSDSQNVVNTYSMNILVTGEVTQ